jgi:hypothetical protein
MTHHLLPCCAFTVKFSSSLLHPISHPSWYRTFETLTRRWFGKTAVTFRYELEIKIFSKLGRIFLHPFTHIPLGWGSKSLDCPNSASKCIYLNSCPALRFVLKLCEFLLATPSIQLSLNLACFLWQ